MYKHITSPFWLKECKKQDYLPLLSLPVTAIADQHCKFKQNTSFIQSFIHLFTLHGSLRLEEQQI